MEKACRNCKTVFDEGSLCPVCKGANITRTWKGTVVVFDIESDVAKKLGITAPGKYALWVK